MIGERGREQTHDLCLILTGLVAVRISSSIPTCCSFCVVVFRFFGKRGEEAIIRRRRPRPLEVPVGNFPPFSLCFCFCWFVLISYYLRYIFLTRFFFVVTAIFGDKVCILGRDFFLFQWWNVSILSEIASFVGSCLGIWGKSCGLVCCGGEFFSCFS